MDPNQIREIQGIVLLVLPLVVIAFAAIVILPYWFIWKKAGFSPLFSLLMFIPMVNLIMLYVLAFSPWKVVPAPPPAYEYYPPAPPPPRG